MINEQIKQEVINEQIKLKMMQFCKRIAHAFSHSLITFTTNYLNTILLFDAFTLLISHPVFFSVSYLV